jgi:hypothetical protein
MRIKIHFAIACLLMIVVACSNDFLNPKSYESHILTDTLYISQNNKDYSIPLTLPLDMSEDFTIIGQPACMKFTSQKGTFSHGSVTLQFTTDMSNFSGVTGDIGQKIVLKINNIGLLTIFVRIGTPHIPDDTNQNSPFITLSGSVIELKIDESKTITIGNTGKETLFYQINNIPQWLTVSDYQGNLNEGEQKNITISAKTTGLQEGDYSATIGINSNASNGNISFQVNLHIIYPTLNQANTKAIHGKVTDAEYNKNTDLLLITTQIPNQLIIFSKDTVQTIISLDKSPNCVSISEDGKRAVIGYNLAAVSLVDLESKSIVKTIDSDCIPFDIVLGDQDWCYLISATGDWEYLRNVNLKTGQVVKSGTYSTTHSKMILRKIPGKPYLLASNTVIYSNGLIMMDISKGIASDTIPYWFIDTNNFWLSPDGTRIYTGVKNVHRTPEYTTSETYFYSLPIIAQLQPAKDNIVWVDHCEANNSIFVVESPRPYDSEMFSNIEQFDSGNFNLKKLITPDRYKTTINGTNIAYQTIAKYAFAKSDGTKLFVVKNVLEQYNTQAWSMEAIQLN